MQRYFAKSKEDKNFILEDSDIHHIKNVMRMQEGSKIEVVYENELFICCIDNVKNDIKVSTIEKLENENDNFIKVNLIVPLLKEQKMDFILQKATELGVDTITPVLLNRSIIKVKDGIDKKIVRWNKIVKEASEQSKRVTVPKIENVKKIEELKNLEGLNLVCSTQEKTKNIKNIVKNNKNYDKMNVVIGPEGGLEEVEEDTLVSYGFNRVSLGNRIMRVETVPLFIMSVINYEYME